MVKFGSELEILSKKRENWVNFGVKKENLGLKMGKLRLKM